MPLRVPLPGFVRRRPFPWALAASVVAAWCMAEYGMQWTWTAESNEGELAAHVMQVAAFALPFVVTGVAWGRIGRRARLAALAVCMLWGFSTSHVVRAVPGFLRAFVPNTRVVARMLREPRRALRTPPADAAARALAAGDTFFLGYGGSCGLIPYVDSATARRHGVRVIAGTFHDGEALTAEHRHFEDVARDYAYTYNGVILDRLGIETTGDGDCADFRELRRGDRFFWP